MSNLHQRVVDPLTDAPPTPNAESVAPDPARGWFDRMEIVSEEESVTTELPFVTQLVELLE